ncbi:stage V sporulation protein AD [Paenibacillus sp. N1-5-1-14]|uniref:stage V sporulation protein AD n=1 Tax=Paenibacillus radicibacter TaxID=2972488 RepID=UPI002159094A|nr:stage V sporulation protein AD [Paenibacillus radicibacter]MCR8645742.1 stage V sporulation protein AD [Paenibacillus radicibacter]
MLKGKQTWLFDIPPIIISSSAVVGPDEGQGPLQNDFDIVHDDSTIQESTWEKAEKKLLEQAAQIAVQKANLKTSDMDFYIGGDLMNQIISASFSARTLAIPYIGIFGACSTSMEGLALGSMIVASGGAQHVLCGTGSHNSSVEKQFRYPTEYGSQKPPTAQYTVTGAGACVLARFGKGPCVTSATIGKVVDMGITDPFNMGAAMAPAAVDTIETHFKDLNRDPSYYDLIVTGDLAAVGHDIAKALFKERNFPINHTKFGDCGLMIYDREKQAVQAGGSGAACSAVVTYGTLLKRLNAGELKRILVVATGALLSPLTFQQDESIPCIAHAVAIENGGN